MQLLPKQSRHQSQPVPEDRIKELVCPLIEEMVELCTQPVGKFPAAHAIAHCQVEEDNPLRFFVCIEGFAVVNPRIIEKSEPFMHTEGCYSFPYRDPKKVRRFNRVKVEYIEVKKGKMFGWSIKKRVREFTDLQACIYQHEIGHFNCHTIY